MEEFLPGREFTIALIGNRNPCILPSWRSYQGSNAPRFHFVYSFETKSGNLEQVSCPAAIEPQLLEALEQMALRVFAALQCRDVARIDIRLNREGLPCFLEVNPLPGLSSVSLLPLQAQAAGISFTELINAILSAAIERYPHLQSKVGLKEAALG